MDPSEKLDPLLAAFDEYAKRKPETEKVSLDESTDIDICDDPECMSCRLIEYQEAMATMLEAVVNAPDEELQQTIGTKDLVSPTNLARLLTVLRIKVEMLEVMVAVLLGNGGAALETIRDSQGFFQGFQTVMDKEKE